MHSTRIVFFYLKLVVSKQFITLDWYFNLKEKEKALKLLWKLECYEHLTLNNFLCLSIWKGQSHFEFLPVLCQFFCQFFFANLTSFMSVFLLEFLAVSPPVFLPIFCHIFANFGKFYISFSDSFFFANLGLFYFFFWQFCYQSFFQFCCQFSTSFIFVFPPFSASSSLDLLPN